MLQIYYDAMFEWTETGMPIARALFINDPDDAAVYDYLDDQFFVGRDFLVAPILFPAGGAPSGRDVYLPAGSDWYAFRDYRAELDTPVAGGRTLRRDGVGLEETPIYVRAGAILPMRSMVEQYVGELPHNPLEISIYPGPDRHYLMYQDDGTTMNAARRNAYRTTRISHRTIAGGISVRLQRIHGCWQHRGRLGLPLRNGAFALSKAGRRSPAQEAKATPGTKARRRPSSRYSTPPRTSR
jgi:alpha-glucosidase